MPSYSGYRQNYSDLFFTPTYNQQTSPVDLEQLVASYDSLQKRHDNAIALQSKYLEALGELDINPAESEYLNNLASSLSSELYSNANYNNVGFGANAMIKKYGDIMFNQGLRGRLDNQRDWKAFQASIDANTTLSADTKQYLKENNPYNYIARFDEQGRELRGEAWSPTINPVNTVSHAAIVAQAVQMAAEEEGQGNQTRFFDANGNITTDPSKAVDGEVYSVTTSSWKKLSKDKIKQALRTILSDSAVAESLDQDYRVALWKKQKDGSNPLVEDANGITLNKEQFIDSVLEGGINAAIYNNVKTITDYSNLAKARESFAKGALRTNDIAETNTYFNSDGTLSGYSHPMQIEYQLGSDLSSAKQNALSNLVSLLGANLEDKPLMDFINQIEKADGTKLDEIYNQIIQQVPEQNREKFTNRYNQLKREYINARTNYESLFEGLSDDKKNVADFTLRAENGLGFNRGVSKYDDDILDAINLLFGDSGEYVDIETSSDKNYNNLKYLYGDKFETSTNERGNKYFRLYKKDYNKIVDFAKGLGITDERGGVQQFFRTFFGPKLMIGVYDKDGNTIVRNGSDYANYSNLKGLSLINEIVDNARKETTNATNLTREINVGNVLTGRISGKDYAAYRQYQQGIIKIDDYDKIVDKDITPELDRIAGTFDASQGDMWALNEDGTRSERIVNAADRQKIQREYNTAYNHDSKNIKIQVADNGLYGPVLDISYPIYNSDGKVTGDRRHFATTAINDPILQEIANSVSYRNNKKLLQIGLTGKQYVLLNDDDIAGFGTNSLRGISQDAFEYSIDGQYVSTLNKTQANQLMQAIDKYLSYKYNITSSDITAMNQADALAFSNTLADIATKISIATNGLYTPEQILYKLNIDFLR